jgi:hypothetical protein
MGRRLMRLWCMCVVSRVVSKGVSMMGACCGYGVCMLVHVSVLDACVSIPGYAGGVYR